MPRRAFEVRIHVAGVVAPTDATVDFTIPGARLIVPPEFGGQTVRPLEGTADMLPYSVQVIDDDGWFTAQAFSNGRPALVGRLAELRASEDGGQMNRVDVRRVAALRGGTEPEYTLELSDERWLGRGDMLFEQNTTLQLVPQMPASPWFLLDGGQKTDPLAAGAPGDVVAVSGGFLLIQSAGSRIDPEIKRAGVDDDVIDLPIASNTLGNFVRLRFEDANGVVRPVVSFGALSAATKEDVLGDWKVAPEGTPPIMPNFWIYWPTHSFSVGENVGAWRLFWPEGLPTTETTPYLVGQSQETAYPLSEFLDDILSGVYGGEPLRFDSLQLAALTRDLGQVSGNWWIVTSPIERDQFLAALYRASFIVPFTDGDGRLAPREIVPASVDGSTLFTIDASTARTPPTYEAAGRDLANAYRLTHLQAATVSRVFGSPLRSITRSALRQPLQVDAGIPDTRQTFRDEREQVMTPGAAADVLADFVPPLFDLAGVGAQVGTVQLQPTDDAPLPGDTVIVDLDSLRGPNPGTAARGGRRAAVVLERRRVWQAEETYYEAVFWDLGPDLNTSRVHQDAEAHGDTHSDATHADSPHDDVAHSDTSHSDSHSDSGHSDTAHSDSAHSDHDDAHSDTHLDHQDGIHADDHSDHSDAGAPTHDDVAHSDVSHSDSPHGDSHSDTAHSDSPHGDSAHSDAAHDDTHSDAAHLDSPHGDLPHGDAHDDIAHGDDIHGDAAHGDSLHGDQPHEDHDDTHDDAHLDHSDATFHGDDHSDHADGAHTDHDDTAHSDASHSDTSHSDQDHTDWPVSSNHDDVAHNDAAHDDGHTDVAHNDLAA